MSIAALPEVYQLRIRLCAISPLIWRRLLVRSDTSIADLHHLIQLAFGWTDSHLHRFVIHGKAYGIAYIGGITFTDNPRQVRLATFCFRPNERFLYECDFHDLWRHEIRLEQILSFVPTQIYPVCTGGARAAPPEECGGPQAFLAWRQHFSIVQVAERLVAVLTKDDEIDDRHAELETLRYWSEVDQFDRRALNHQLRQDAETTAAPGASAEVSV